MQYLYRYCICVSLWDINYRLETLLHLLYICMHGLSFAAEANANPISIIYLIGYNSYSRLETLLLYLHCLSFAARANVHECNIGCA